MLGIINFFFLPSQSRAKSIFEENSTWKKLFICLFLSLLMALMIFSVVYVAPQITGKENVITNNIDWITVSSFIVKDPIWNIFTFWQGAPIVNNILFVVVGAFAFFATSWFSKWKFKKWMSLVVHHKNCGNFFTCLVCSFIYKFEKVSYRIRKIIFKK